MGARVSAVAIATVLTTVITTAAPAGGTSTSDDDALVSSSFGVAGVIVELWARPDDPGWAEFMTDQVSQALPVLIELIGPWPAATTLTITESMEPAASGYAGYYLPSDNAIVIDDARDPRVIVHEVAHAWFNSTTFSEPWINEGLAEEYATRALDRLGYPSDPPVVDRDAAGAVALNAWELPAVTDGRGDAASLEYGYTASWYVFHQILEEIGEPAMRAVLAAARHDDIAYGGDPMTETVPEPPRWQQLLDLLENVGHSQVAATLFETFVATAADQVTVVVRADARDRYAALQTRSGAWTPPFELRELMATWQFDAVADSISRTEAVLCVRDRIDGLLPWADLALRAVERSYESSDDIGGLLEHITDEPSVRTGCPSPFTPTG